MTDVYAVIGNPVHHSLSPEIHTQFAQRTSQDLRYGTIEAPIEEFVTTVRQFMLAGGRGLNVTVPFKKDAFELADNLTPEAERAGAVNTLQVLPSGALLGHNTDGLGLLRDLTQNLKVELNAKRILIIGAGGATRGILQPLLSHQPRQIFIANRTPAKAQMLAEIFSDLGNLQGNGLEYVPHETFDVVINASASSLSGEMPLLPETIVKSDTLCYDLMYTKSREPTVFCQWALDQGAGLVVDGLGMLVEQAAESFALWRGIRPPTEDIIAVIASGKPTFR
jgi:shikimate dehydrogenase